MADLVEFTDRSNSAAAGIGEGTRLACHCPASSPDILREEAGDIAAVGLRDSCSSSRFVVANTALQLSRILSFKMESDPLDDSSNPSYLRDDPIPPRIGDTELCKR